MAKLCTKQLVTRNRMLQFSRIIRAHFGVVATEIGRVSTERRRYQDFGWHDLRPHEGTASLMAKRGWGSSCIRYC